MSVSSRHRFLICGLGSMGARHARNLLALGESEIALVRRPHAPQRAGSPAEAPDLLALPCYEDLDAALVAFRPTVVFVTNPTALHLPVAQRAAAAGCHLFIEKPVSHTLEGVAELQVTLAAVRRHAMVGYMLRFHPLLVRVKEWIDLGEAGPLGRPLFVRASWGEHVADWHPWEDYREGYAVRRALGGGAALTLSHEIDLVVWMLGRARSIQAAASFHGPLASDADESVDLLLGFDGGARANVHLDLWQQPPERQWALQGTKGRVVFDYHGGTLVRTEGQVGVPSGRVVDEGPAAETIRVPEGFERNDMFLAELRHFLLCLAEDKAPAPTIEDAAESVRIAVAATAREEVP